MVDRTEIESALSHISERSVAEAQKRALAVDFKFNRAGRFRSGSHIRALFDTMTEVNAAALSDMGEKVRHYAGADAAKHVDLLTEAAGTLATCLKAQVNQRMRDTVPTDQRQELLHGFDTSAASARDAMMRDLKHKLSDPEGALPWWRRTRAKDQAVGFVVGVAATIASTIAGAYLLKWLELSQ